MCISAAAERISHLYLLPRQQKMRQRVSVEEVQKQGLSRPNATMPKNNAKEKKQKAS